MSVDRIGLQIGRLVVHGGVESSSRVSAPDLANGIGEAIQQRLAGSSASPDLAHIIADGVVAHPRLAGIMARTKVPR